eukprot:COSAG04_NODE_1865_length_5359_cov_3.964449_10_plen_51_part_00
MNARQSSLNVFHSSAQYTFLLGPGSGSGCGCGSVPLLPCPAPRASSFRIS